MCPIPTTAARAGSRTSSTSARRPARASWRGCAASTGCDAPARRLAAALARALGSPVARSSGLAGGDINEAAQVTLADGRELFVKTNPGAPPTMFAAEARGLAWLAEARALRLPEVVAVSAPGDPMQFLVLELMRRGRPARGFDEALGRGLAALHRFGAPGFGLDHDNFIGRLPQANGPASDPGSWAGVLSRAPARAAAAPGHRSRAGHRRG